MSHSPILDIRALVTELCTEEGPLRAVDGLTLAVNRGEAVGLVGESGCGKTATALSVLRLVPPPGRISRGEILFDGIDLLSLSEQQMRALRGNKIAMIFQEPMTSLNPVLTIGEQVGEVLRVHRGATRVEARRRARELLQLVRLPAAEQRLSAFPHQLSGGMRQRVMIAMALACEPALLIADEPTTALDATVQVELLDLLADLQRRLELAVLLISHDLTVVSRLCQRLAVIYAGHVVESGPTEEVLGAPLHPYTAALKAALPDPLRPREPLVELPTGEGESQQRLGCRFANRCSYVTPKCTLGLPPLKACDECEGRAVRCVRPLQVNQG